MADYVGVKMTRIELGTNILIGLVTFIICWIIGAIVTYYVTSDTSLSDVIVNIGIEIKHIIQRISEAK